VAHGGGAGGVGHVGNFLARVVGFWFVICNSALWGTGRGVRGESGGVGR
jgi:hypothetical protein